MGPRQQAKERTRVALIEAGIELISAQGIDAPSLDAICACAGYTRGAFYVHFADRDDFLAAVMDHAGRPLLDTLLKEGDDLLAIATRMVTAFLDGSFPMGPGGNIKPHQFFQACARSERIRALYVTLVTEAIERLDRALVTSQGRGLLRDDVSSRELATVLLTIVVGGQTMLELGAPLDPAACAQTVLSVLAPGAEAPSRARRRVVPETG